MLQEVVGSKVREIRNSLLISQFELSKLTGIERAQISKIEQGKVNLTLETLEKLSIALKVDVSELISSKKRYDIKPFVKWAGGKTQILNKLNEYLPNDFNDYYEPFVGGGALLFALTPKVAYINDVNSELLCAYRCFQDSKICELMLDELIKHENEHSEEHYYSVREMDRDLGFKKLPIYIRAARMIYLNKACFNGLYRVNAKGFFNVPSGNKKKVVTFDRKNIEEIEKYFHECSINVSEGDFEQAVSAAKKGDFVYFDPPYDVIENKNSFTSYAKNDFGKDEQIRLAMLYKKLSARGVSVMLSNHNTAFINELYKGFNIHVVNAKRMINSKADGRGDVEEVIITNY